MHAAPAACVKNYFIDGPSSMHLQMIIHLNFLLAKKYIANPYPMKTTGTGNYGVPEGKTCTKAKLLQVGFFFALNFLTWEFLLVKKLEVQENKTNQFTTFKIDILKMVLVFSISNIFANKNSQGRKLSAI